MYHERCGKHFNVRCDVHDAGVKKGKKTNFFDPIFISLQLPLSHFLAFPVRVTISYARQWKSIEKEKQTEWSGRENVHWLRDVHFVLRQTFFTRAIEEHPNKLCIMYSKQMMMVMRGKLKFRPRRAIVEERVFVWKILVLRAKANFSPDEHKFLAKKRKFAESFVVFGWQRVKHLNYSSVEEAAFAVVTAERARSFSWQPMKLW